MALKKQQTQTDVPIVPPGTKPVYEKQTNKKRKLSPTTCIFLMLGHPFDNCRPLMGSLCVAVSCRVPQALWLTAAPSLWSDQCCLSLQCSNQWNTSQAQLHPEKTPTAFVQTQEYYPSLQVALEVAAIPESKRGNKEQKGQQVSFPSMRKVSKQKLS